MAQNDNMYDETIQRHARRSGVAPISFTHPRLEDVRRAVLGGGKSVVLTGTAGDGKTHLCREMWQQLGGPVSEWDKDNPYLQRECRLGGRSTQLHVIRDLSAWVPQQGMDWEPAKARLLSRFCASLFEEDPEDVFLIAANDGQLIETLKRLSREEGPSQEEVAKAFKVLETLLFEDRGAEQGVAVRMFNLSRSGSRGLLDLALEALLDHEGWQACYDADVRGPFFGDSCPIRHNYELLSRPQVKNRLRQLLSLCHHNGFHVPIRQILLLLANAILGHPDVAGKLMRPTDLARILHKGTRAQASLYGNIFGRNLKNSRRRAILIFRYLDHFRIGYETSNRIDELLVYGNEDASVLKLLREDTFYGADDRFMAARTEYMEAEGEFGEQLPAFLQQLVRLRRSLFFMLPGDSKDLWKLTAFQFAGEYLEKVVDRLRDGKTVAVAQVRQLILGLNRIFTGMLVTDDSELLLASGVVSSQARVSTLLKARIRRSLATAGQRVEIVLEARIPTLKVWISRDISRSFPLLLTRYEFLSRVAHGGLPGSFSNEFYEDVRAFKSQLLSDLKRRDGVSDREAQDLQFEILELNEKGQAKTELLEVHYA